METGLVLLLAGLVPCLATVDLTLPELQHLADRLSHEECRRLGAALHCEGFTPDPALESVEVDTSCLRLLLHWNSAPNEGRGETHEKLSLRLRQLGRGDLASWLDSAVLRELAEEVNRTAEEFRDKPANSSPLAYDNNFDQDSSGTPGDDFLWDVLFGTAPVVFLVIFGVLLFLCVRRIMQRYKFSRNSAKRKQDVKKIGSKIYQQL